MLTATVTQTHLTSAPADALTDPQQQQHHSPRSLAEQRVCVFASPVLFLCVCVCVCVVIGCRCVCVRHPSNDLPSLLSASRPFIIIKACLSLMRNS